MTPERGNGRDLDDGLAAAAQRGDEVALSRLMTRWEDPLQRFCRRILGGEQEARDLAHDALLRATRRLDCYDPRRPFAPWLYRLTRNLCLTHLHRERRRRRPVSPRPSAPVPPPDLIVARREEVQAVLRALRRLGEDDRRLLDLRLVQGLGVPEIAARLGLRTGTVRTRASRALTRLRKLLGRKSEEDRP